MWAKAIGILLQIIAVILPEWIRKRREQEEYLKSPQAFEDKINEAIAKHDGAAVNDILDRVLKQRTKNKVENDKP